MLHLRDSVHWLSCSWREKEEKQGRHKKHCELGKIRGHGMGWTSYKKYQLSKTLRKPVILKELQRLIWSDFAQRVHKMRPYKNTWKANCLKKKIPSQPTLVIVQF